MPGWRTVRVFLSSTFRDMHAERDYLVKVTFPALRQWCAERRLFFDEIDLRWGITRQEADEGKALEICLREVDGARPFFLCLLGERYGWVPDELPPEELYEFRGIQAETHLSITHLEILHAALAPLRSRTPHPDFPRMQAYFYLRDPACVPPPETVPAADREAFRDVYYERLAERAEQLRALKGEVCQRFAPSGHATAYRGTWVPEAANPELGSLRGRLTGLEELGRRVEANLRQGIEAVFADHLAGGDDDPEPGLHEAYTETRLRAHVRRPTVEAELTHYLNDPSDRRPLVVAGPPGSGKSTLLACWARQVAAEWFTVARFVGASPASVGLAQLLAEICRRIDERFALPEDVPDGQLLNATLRKWRRYLEAAGERRILIVIDAVDQLDDRAEPGGAGEWLPTPLPPGVKLVVSAAAAADDRPGARWLACLRALDVRGLDVPPLDRTECEAILRDVPSLVCKSLTREQVDLLLNNLATRNPLFLRVVLDELRVFGSFDRLTDEIAALPTGEPDDEAPLHALFGRVLDRLAEETTRHFPALDDLVGRLFSWLTTVREGLTESEMLALLRDAYPTTEPADLSAAVAIILRQVRVYLMMKSHPQGLLWDFYHRSFWVAARRKFAGRSAERQLAAYFHGTPTRLSDREWNARKVAELPRLQQAAGLWADFVPTTTTVDWVAASAELGMASELAERHDAAHAEIRTIDPLLAEWLVARAAAAITPADGPEHAVFNIDNVHSWLFIRQDQTFYHALLRAICGTDPLARPVAIRAAAYLAEQYRRIPDYPTATQLFEMVAPALEAAGMWREAARVAYGRAYIRYLTAAAEDELTAAADLMEQSVLLAERGVDPVGAAIGRCLADSFRDLRRCLAGGRDLAHYRETVTAALAVFEQAAASVNADPRAERWVRNAAHQLFDIAVDSGDRAAAERWHYRCLSNPWELRYGDETDRRLLTARLRAFQGRWADAVAMYEASRATTPRRWELGREVVARLYYEYGHSLWHSGRTEEAKTVWEVGRQARLDQGNFVWLRLIEAALADLATR